MTRNEFISNLREELKKNNVSEVEEIIAEYQEHFDFKIEEGKTEEEIARKLSSPQEIAKEYTGSERLNNKFEKNVKIAGLTVISIPSVIIYIVMWAAVAVLGVFAICCAVLGFCLITKINIAGLIPNIPYLSALIAGISLFGLTLLVSVGMIYLSMYVKQWGKCYIRWCKNIAGKNIYPALSKQPKLSKKTAYKMKMVVIIGLVIFVMALVIAYAHLCIYTNSLEPWHVLHWFM